MSLRPLILWRSLALALWLISIACLFKALGDATTVGESLYNPHLSDADRTAIQHLQTMADTWAWVGWSIQAGVAVVLSGGIDSEKTTRRIFVSLGILIAADGVLLLLVAVLIH